MKYKIAKKVIDKMVKSSKEFDELLSEIKNECSEEEFKVYQNGFAQVLGYILLDIINPIINEHPELKPKELE